MIVTKKALERRTLLRGLGATIALPLLDSMVPAFTALAKSAAAPITRLGVVYLPNGVMVQNWNPATEGPAFEFSPTLTPLEPFRRQILVLSGLSSGGGVQVPGVHARASTKFLTDLPPKSTAGAELQAGVSINQLVAAELGKQTQLSSLEVSLESGDSGSGTCDVGYSCAYTNTIAWRSANTPLPMEANPRAVFERLFGDAGSTDPAARLRRGRQDRSILDSVNRKIAGLQRRLSDDDRRQLGQLVEAIRDVERRIQKAEEQSTRELPVVGQPVGVPDGFEQYARVMFDLQVLAFQCDLTRVITFMMGREFSGRSYPEIGVPESHHPLSHHQNSSENLNKLAKVNVYQAVQFAYFLERLQATPDGDGSLLDHAIIVYGAGMSDGNSHSPKDLPIVLAGGGSQLRSGRHIRYPAGTPLANLHISLLDKSGVHVDAWADSTGSLAELSGV